MLILQSFFSLLTKYALLHYKFNLGILYVSTQSCHIRLNGFLAWYICIIIKNYKNENGITV